jgi:hypothetical protein
VWQPDGKAFWVEAGELTGNAHCLLLQRSAGVFPVTHQLRRLDLGAVSRTALLWVNSPEPCQVLISLALGPQALLEDVPQVPRKVRGLLRRRRRRCLPLSSHEAFLLNLLHH